MFAFTCLGGCAELGLGTLKWNLTDKKPDVEENVVDGPWSQISESLAYRDTVSEQGWVEGLRLMRVRGFGIVAGLGTRGSRECPRNIRDRLVQEMYKRKEFQGAGLKPAPVSPERIIDDLDTAVVLIEGDIPAAAAKGERFDVMIRAIPGTQTTSLEGGRLYTADLHIYRDTQTAASIEGKVLAMAAGPIFLNPFGGSSDTATAVDPREGMVLGGGVVKEDRRVRFVLSRPSYRRATVVADCINARFSGTRKAAEATSPSYVELRIPPQYRDDAFHFLALVRHLYLPQTPGFTDHRARELASEILSESAPHPDIALAWEGIGRTTLPIVQELYTSDKPHAAFYSALAGLRLGDDVAVDVMRAVAGNPESPYRQIAIEELGRAETMPQAAYALRELLNDTDPRIRVEAYEALLSRHDRLIDTRIIGDGSFALDLVPSTAPNLIYIRRTGQPRIALIGAGARCMPPLFYRDESGSLTINADINDSHLTLIRKTPFKGRVSPPLPCDFELAALVAMLGDDPRITEDKSVHGLAMDYSSIARALYALCQSDSVDARFMMQTVSLIDVLGPTAPAGRAESDL